MRALWAHLVPSVTGCLAIMIAGFPLRALLVAGSLPTIVTLFVTGLACLTVYLLTVRAAFPAAWEDVMLVARRILPSRRSRAAAEATAVPAFNPGGN
jgi:hypothetical protein